MISYDTHETSSHILTPEGAQIVLEGSHEARVWGALPAKGEGDPMGVQELKKKIGDEAAKVGQGRAFKNNWIVKEGSGFVKAVSRSAILILLTLICICEVAHITDSTQIELREVESTGTLQAGEKALAELRKRKLVIQRCPRFSCVAINNWTSFIQERTMVHGAQGSELQHIHCETRN